jgi:hypothetical protein
MSVFISFLLGFHSSYSQDVSGTVRNDRGSARPASSRASRPLVARNNILFGSSHNEDLVSELIRLKFTIQLLDSKDHQPIINERGHSARDKTKPKSRSS